MGKRTKESRWYPRSVPVVSEEGTAATGAMKLVAFYRGARSKYMPHQGKRECARRREQLSSPQDFV